MKQLKTQGEIEALWEEAIDPLLISYLKRRICSLVEEYEEIGETWNPEEFGYFCLIEEGDDVADLREVGLNPEERGLIGASKEVVAWYPEIRYWETLVLYNDDYGINFFIPDEEWLDPDLRSILIEEAEAEILRPYLASANESSERMEE